MNHSIISFDSHASIAIDRHPVVTAVKHLQHRTASNTLLLGAIGVTLKQEPGLMQDRGLLTLYQCTVNSGAGLDFPRKDG